MKFNFNNLSIRKAAMHYLEETRDNEHERFLFVALLAKKDWLFDAIRKGTDYEEAMNKLTAVQDAITDKLEGGTRWKEV